MRIYNDYLSIPDPIRQGIKSAIVSTFFTANTIIGTAYAFAVENGQGDSLTHFSVYLAKSWFPLLMSYLYGTAVASSFRARQAATATLPSSPKGTAPNGVTNPGP
jgi:hypothetical protein